MRFLERQVLFNHELEHKKEMAFRVVLLVPKHGVPLGFCDLFVDHGFLDQFCNEHVLGQEFLCKATPELVTGCCIVSNPKKAVGT